MAQQSKIHLFEERKVRILWDDEQEKWYFSIVDVVGVLTDSVNPATYWRKLKQRLKAEGNETVTDCHGLKMRAIDGKMRMTDVADTEQLFRLIQAIPSPIAEPFKLWMAQVASERLDQMQDPELSIDQAMTDHIVAAQKGGEVARNARLELELKTGKKVVSSLNAKSIHKSIEDKNKNE